MRHKLLFFAPIFFAVTYAQSNQPNQPTNQPNQPTNQPNQPTNQPNQPTNQPNQPTNQPNQPTNQPTNRNCLGKSHQPNALDDSTDFWVEEKGNKYVLQALNAAMYNINKNSNWRRILTELGGTFVNSVQVSWPSSVGANGTFEYMMRTRKIRFGSTLTFFPFSTNDTGCINGTEIELANMIAQEFTKQYSDTPAPFEATWVRIDRTGDFWYDIAFALSGDQEYTNDYPPIDVILSTVTKTAKREKGGMARFTTSYLSQQYGIVLSDQGAKKGLNLSTLDNANYKIAVGIGTTNFEFVNRTYPNIQKKLCENISQRMDAVKMDQSDAAIGDATFIKNWAKMNNKKYLGPVGDVTELAMAVRPAKQPSAKAAVKECTLLEDPTSSSDRHCYKKKSSSCWSCWGSSCSSLINQRREGSCCGYSSCCKKRVKGRCKKSVTRQDSVKCKVMYVVKFKAQGMNEFTEQMVDGIYFKECGTSKQCVDHFMQNSSFKKNRNVECTVSSTGAIEFPVVEELYSSASYRFVSSCSILFIIVWFFSS